MNWQLIGNPLGRPRSAWEQQNHDQLKRRQAVLTYLRAMFQFFIWAIPVAFLALPANAGNIHIEIQNLAIFAASV